MTDTPKRGRGRPPSEHTRDWREFDALVHSDAGAHLRTPEAQAYAEKINGAVAEDIAAALASSRASYVLHNSPSPEHNLEQIEGRRARIAEVARRLAAASERESRLSAVALARAWQGVRWEEAIDGEYPARSLADYIRSARKLTGLINK